MSDATDVLQAIDQLRRDLSGYHGQLKAHDDLQRHCERQKEQLAALQAAHKPIKDERDLYKRQADRLAAENAKLRKLVWHMHTCMEHYELDGSVSCDRCPLDNDTGDCDYEQRMQELGIEDDA